MKKKLVVGKRYFWVREPVFRRKVHVFLGYSNSEFDRWWAKGHRLVKEGVDDPAYNDNFLAFSTQINEDNKATEWCIVLGDFNWTIDNQGTLIHEVVHTIIKIWALNNIPVTKENQEFLAHEVAILYEDIAGKIFRLKRKAKT